MGGCGESGGQGARGGAGGRVGSGRSWFGANVCCSPGRCTGPCPHAPMALLRPHSPTPPPCLPVLPTAPRQAGVRAGNHRLLHCGAQRRGGAAGPGLLRAHLRLPSPLLQVSGRGRGGCVCVCVQEGRRQQDGGRGATAHLGRAAFRSQKCTPDFTSSLHLPLPCLPRACRHSPSPSDTDPGSSRKDLLAASSAEQEQEHVAASGGSGTAAGAGPAGTIAGAV